MYKLKDDDRDHNSKQKEKQDCLKILKKDCTTKTALIVTVITAIPIIVAGIIYKYQNNIYSIFEPFHIWFRTNHVKGFFAFASIYMIWVPFTLPSFVVTLVGGYIFADSFGVFKGFFICMSGILLGHPPAAFMTMMMGRYCLRDYI